MGASSRSPSPMTMVPRMGIESMVLRMASVATWSESLRSPWPMVCADAMAATSTTRRNRDARSLSMFSPKLRALLSERVCVAMGSPRRLKQRMRRVETIAQPCREWKERSCLSGDSAQRLIALDAGEIQIVVERDQGVAAAAGHVQLPSRGGLSHRAHDGRRYAYRCIHVDTGFLL